MTLQIQLSGGNGNTDINASLGGVISGTALVDATDENLMDNITRKEIILGKTEYRGFYVKNTHATSQVHGAVLYVDADPTQTLVTFGLDSAGTGDGSASGVMQTIGTEDTAPTGITFYDAGEFRLKLPLPILQPLESIGIWIKRVSVGSGVSESLVVGVTLTGNEEAPQGGPGDEDFHWDDGISIGERTEMIGFGDSFDIGVAQIGFSEIE